MSDSALNPKRRGLGRGLDALFESEETSYDTTQDNSATAATSAARKTVGMEQLYPNAKQPRKFFRKEAIEELASSLKEYGILQPLLVRPGANENTYEIIAGERRWRAAQMAQLHEIPVIIKDFDDSETLQVGLVENLQREDLNPIEEALGYQNLIEEFGHTQKDVAVMVGKSRSQVTNMLRLLTLPESVQNMLEQNQISTGHARALIGNPDAELLAKKIQDEDFSVRDIEALMSSPASSAKSAPSAKKTKDPDTRALEKEISDTLGMAVDISVGKGHKGDLKISFKSLEQLDFLLHKLSQH